MPISHKVRGVPAKKKAPAKPVKKAPAKKKVAKKAPAKKAPAKKIASKKTAAKKTVAKKAPAKKSIPVKKVPGRPFPSKAGKTTLTVDEKSQTVSVSTVVAPVTAPVVEERRLVMPPPARPAKSGKKIAPLKPIKAAPTPVTAGATEGPWTAAELKAVKTEISKELVRLRAELSLVEVEMEELIAASGEGAGDDQADSGNKTFEREHEMSLVINARDLKIRITETVKNVETQSERLAFRYFHVQPSA